MSLFTDLDKNPLPVTNGPDTRAQSHLDWILGYVGYFNELLWFVRQIIGGIGGVFGYGADPTLTAKVKENTVPNMTVVINPFAGFYDIYPFRVPDELTTEAFVAPVSDERIDLVVASGDTGAFRIYIGEEDPSPVAPSPLYGDVSLAKIHHRVGETKIVQDDFSGNTDGYIEDVRIFINI